MSHFCKSHPRYEGKSEPNSICGDCFQLWRWKNPELNDPLYVREVDAARQASRETPRASSRRRSPSEV